MAMKPVSAPPKSIIGSVEILNPPAPPKMNSVSKFKDETINCKDYVESLSTTVNGEIGGEAIILRIDIYDNGDKKDNIYTNAKITVNCYGESSAEIRIFGAGFEGLNKACQSIESILRNYKK